MNRLGNETSLYLLQHADNPVHWRPWDDEALAEARDSGRPILLSIGYSACHWCHVMAHESFEDEETAELMNRLFVNVKVDREERPDLDRIYQLAHQLMTGRGGGWPLTVFLEPGELVPFFAGTYFPREPRYGMPSFRHVLTSLDRWYRESGDEVGEQNGKVAAALKSVQRPMAEAGLAAGPDLADTLGEQFRRQLEQRFDAVNGGYGSAPKFPQAPLLEAVAGFAPDIGLRESLLRMARSGLRDHLDGGFFRYCVDASWTIPHFEKMLYDNAMLLPLYAEAAQRWKDPELAAAVAGIVDWLQAEMKRPEGGYAASIDADAGGEEGAFHTWQPAEVGRLLGDEDAGLFARLYGLDGEPNFEGKSWHLLQQITPAELARERELDAGELNDRMESARAALLKARELRVHPTRDDKILTSWNALLAAGLVRAGRALERPGWLDLADGILDFIRGSMWRENGLLAVHASGIAKFPAYLDDYAFLLDALTVTLQSRWQRRHLDFATAVADALLSRFEAEEGAFYFNDADVPVPVARPMNFTDDATPNGNAVAIRGLLRLGHLLGDSRYLDAADRALHRALPSLRDHPLACASLLRALENSARPRAHLVISGSDPEQAGKLKSRFAADGLDCYLIGPPDGTLPGILAEYRTSEPFTAWLCRGVTCQPPVHSAEELQQLIDRH